jgi:hypothetical protein
MSAKANIAATITHPMTVTHRGSLNTCSTVVIHTGHRVLGGLLEVAFVTQRVTSWLNLIGAVALLILLWNVIAPWCGPCINMR